MFVEALLLAAATLLVIFMPITGMTGLIIVVAILLLCIPTFRLLKGGEPPFVPTPSKTVDAMIRLTEVSKGDIVYDLGCGDGRFLIAAAKQGATAIGYELSVPTLILAKWRTRKYPSISVRYGDFWKQDISNADVVVCYLLIAKMAQFERDVWPKLKAGCRVVSHMFSMPNVQPVSREGKVIVYVKQ